MTAALVERLHLWNNYIILTAALVEELLHYDSCTCTCGTAALVKQLQYIIITAALVEQLRRYYSCTFGTAALVKQIHHYNSCICGTTAPL